ncbi:MAG TPA: isoprenyl transferase, partial [bacterium]|nr:isoprenyl transferase [bacterium]
EICDAIVNFISDNNPTGDNSLCLSDSVGDCDSLSNIITVENISKYLYVKDSPDPDLIIRTSGEVRLSGFLLWQSAYSEFYFCDAYWPEFREIDFLRAIRSYQLRHLRAGK